MVMVRLKFLSQIIIQPMVEHPPERLRDVELQPFEAAVASEVAMIMTAHVLYPAIDEDHPATTSPQIVTNMLRGDLGFEGMVATDDMSMEAIAGQGTLESAVVAAIGAGCDLVLLCNPDVEEQARCLEAVIRAVEDETLALTRVEDALARHRRVKARFLSGAGARRPLPARELQAVLACDEHVAVAEEMRQFAP